MVRSAIEKPVPDDAAPRHTLDFGAFNDWICSCRAPVMAKEVMRG